MSASSAQNDKNLNFVRRDKVNWLVYGPDRSCFRQKQEIILPNFDQLAFFQSIIFCFLKKKNKEIKHYKLIQITKTKNIYRYYNKFVTKRIKRRF